jgi:hypothetical protein
MELVDPEKLDSSAEREGNMFSTGTYAILNICSTDTLHIFILLNSPLDARVMELTRDFEENEVIGGQGTQDSSVNPSLTKSLFVLWEPHVIQPSNDPMVVQLPGTVLLLRVFQGVKGEAQLLSM